MDQDLCIDYDQTNMDIDFATVHPTANNWLHAALEFPGISGDAVFSLRMLLNPPMLSPHFYVTSAVKTWAMELRAYKDQEPLSCEGSHILTPEDPYAALAPFLAGPIESIGSLPVMQA